MSTGPTGPTTINESVHGVRADVPDSPIDSPRKLASLNPTVGLRLY